MQVQIRQAGGDDVSLDDCARLSTPMGEAIDSAEIFSEAYVLEISSTGIEDQLTSDREFQTFQGFPVEVTYLNDQKIKHHLSGKLHDRSTDHLQMNIKGKIRRIPRKDVIEVCLTSPTG